MRNLTHWLPESGHFFLESAGQNSPSPPSIYATVVKKYKKVWNSFVYYICDSETENWSF